MRALLQDDAARPRNPMEAEEALRFTQLLLDRAGEGAFWTDPDGRFLYVNEAACSMLGYSREELLALSVPDTLPPEQASLEDTIRLEQQWAHTSVAYLRQFIPN